VSHQQSIVLKADERASPAAQRARLDAIAPCEIFECIEIAFSILYALPQDFNASVGRDADVAALKINAACHRLKVPHIFERLTIVLKFSFPAFELSPQP